MIMSNSKDGKTTSYGSVIAAVCLLALIIILPLITVVRMTIFGIPISQYSENIFGKFQMIGLNTRITEMLSGGDYMESSEVLLGKEGWLFYKVTTDGTPLYDYMGINRFTDEELEAIDAGLKAESDEMSSRGIKYTVLTIPNKEQVYDIYMPDTIERISDTSRLDQLTEYLKDRGTDYTYINITDTYMKYRENYPLYYKTDTHYTDEGAYLALTKVMGLPEKMEEISFNRVAGFEGDLARISATLDRYGDNSYEIDPATIPDEDKRDETLLIIGDSFGDAMQHVAVHYYREVYYVGTLEYDPAMLDMYAPDAVIRECVERYLPRLTENKYAK